MVSKIWNLLEMFAKIRKRDFIDALGAMIGKKMKPLPVCIEPILTVQFTSHLSRFVTVIASISSHMRI